MSGSVSASGGPRIIQPSEVSLARALPAAALQDPDAALSAPLGVQLDHVQRHERGGLETVTIGIASSFVARTMGAKDGQATLSERIDSDGSVTGVRGQLYVHVAMTDAEHPEKPYGQFDALVSPAASGGVTMSFLKYPASLTLNEGQVLYTQGKIRIEGELIPVSD